MTALAADANIREKVNPAAFEHAVLGTDSVQYYKGGIVCISQSTGRMVKGSTATGLIAVGVCIENRLTGTSNTKMIRARSGIHGPFANSAAADAIAADDVGKDCYIVDDNTVALTDGTGTRSRAGKIYEVDSEGVWVNFTFPNA